MGLASYVLTCTIGLFNRAGLHLPSHVDRFPTAPQPLLYKNEQISSQMNAQGDLPDLQ